MHTFRYHLKSCIQFKYFRSRGNLKLSRGFEFLSREWHIVEWATNFFELYKRFPILFFVENSPRAWAKICSLHDQCELLKHYESPEKLQYQHNFFSISTYFSGDSSEIVSEILLSESLRFFLHSLSENLSKCLIRLAVRVDLICEASTTFHSWWYPNIPSKP